MVKSRFTTTARLHKPPCPGCDAAVDRAVAVAIVTGSTGATFNDESVRSSGVAVLNHSATVERIKPQGGE